MEIRGNIFVFLTIVVNILSSYAAFVAAPTEINMGDLYRIFYIHTPSALVCYLALGVSLLASILFLVKRRLIYDILAEVSTILGLTFGIITLTTGSIWAKMTWGTYWNWDPRQTTTLILWIVYVGYISLRLSVRNVEKRASIAAVYNVLVFSTVPLSYLSFILWESLHPRIITGTRLALTLPMIETLILNLIAASLVYMVLLRLMYDIRSLEERITALTYEKGGG